MKFSKNNSLNNNMVTHILSELNSARTTFFPGCYPQKTDFNSLERR